MNFSQSDSNFTTGQLHSTKSKLRFCTGSNPARGLSEIRDGNKAKRLSSVNHITKQFIIIKYN